MVRLLLNLNLKFMKLDLRCVHNQVPHLGLSSSRPPRRPIPGPILVVDNSACHGLGLGLENATEIPLVGNNFLGYMSRELSFTDKTNKNLYKHNKKTNSSWPTRPRHLNLTLAHILNNFRNNCVLPMNSSGAIQYICVRNYASRKKRQVNKHPYGSELDEEDSDDTEYVDTDDDDDDDVAGTLPKGWKDVVQVVPSLRLDTVLSAGLGIARKKVEDAFLESKLQVNNERISKKSKMVKAGDVLDLIRDGDGKKDATVMRVIILKIASEKTSKDRLRVKLRRWKKLDLKNGAPAQS